MGVQPTGQSASNTSKTYLHLNDEPASASRATFRLSLPMTLAQQLLFTRKAQVIIMEICYLTSSLRVSTRGSQVHSSEFFFLNRWLQRISGILAVLGYEGIKQATPVVLRPKRKSSAHKEFSLHWGFQDEWGFQTVVLPKAMTAIHFVLLGTVALLLAMPCATKAICLCLPLVRCDDINHHD